MIEVIGVPPSRILLGLSKEGFKAIKDPIQESGKDVKKRAVEMADDFRKSGTYRRAIRRRSRSIKKEGEISTTVGIITSSKAIAYAAKVEHKHRVFNRLGHEFRQPVEIKVKKGIRTGLSTFRLKSAIRRGRFR
jgi:hypothetical protein